MNILLNCNEDIKQLLYFIEKDYNIFQVFNFNDGLEKYKSNNIDLVIIDDLLDTNNKLLNEIVKLNPKQKIIEISEKLVSIEECECCIKNYNRRRLIKPIKPEDLYEMVNEFDNIKCKYHKKINNIKDVLPKFMQKFHCYEYDEETNVIKKNNQLSDTMCTTNLIGIIEMLNYYGVKYNIIDETKIEILS